MGKIHEHFSRDILGAVEVYLLFLFGGTKWVY